MSVRFSIIALAALALTGCKLPAREQAAATAAPRDCCCKVCPTDAAPAAKAAARAEAGSGAGRETATVVRHAPRIQRVNRSPTYARADDRVLSGGDYYASGDTAGRRYQGGYTGGEIGGGYGGRYGSGRAVSGVSVSVEESETSSERVRYRESSSGYASGSSYAAGYSQSAYAATGYDQDRDGRVRRAGPAATDHSGYLTWPGKVED